MSEDSTQTPDFEVEHSIEEFATSLRHSAIDRGVLPTSAQECARLILSGVKEAFSDERVVDVPLRVVEQAQELGRVLRKENYHLRDVYQVTVMLRECARRMLLKGGDVADERAGGLQGRVDRWFDDVVFAAINAFHEAHRNDLQKRIVIDGLTGVFNRSYLSERLAEEIERGRRYSHPVTLLMVDVDSMKPVNDRFGHRTGDAVLKSVSRVLRTQSRSVDVVARYGGDEFAIIMPQTGPEGAWALAERITRGVREIQPEGLRDTISVSVGIASFPRDADTAEGLVDAADKALYRSKSEGGNTIAAFSSRVVPDLGGRPTRESREGVHEVGRQRQEPPGGMVKALMERARRLERENLELTVSLGLARKKLALFERLEGDIHELLAGTLRAAAEAGFLDGDEDQAIARGAEASRAELLRELEQLRAEREAIWADLAKEKERAERQAAEIRAEIDKLTAEERLAQVRRLELTQEIADLSRQRDLARRQMEIVIQQIGDLPPIAEEAVDSQE